MIESRKGSSFIDFENAIDNDASLDELLSIVRSLDDPVDLYNVMDICAGDSYEDNLLWNTAKTKRDVIISLTDRKGSNNSRKGSCGYCERPENLSNIASSIVSGINRKIGEPSRKGSRKGGRYQDALAKYARDNHVFVPIGLSEEGAYDTLTYHAEADDKTVDELIEELEGNKQNIYNDFAESKLRDMKGRSGQRKGATAFATGNSGKLMSDIKGFINNDAVSTKLQKTFGTEDQRNQAILKENYNQQEKQKRAQQVKELNKY